LCYERNEFYRTNANQKPPLSLHRDNKVFFKHYTSAWNAQVIAFLLVLVKYLATNIALGLYDCVLFSDNLTRMTQYSLSLLFLRIYVACQISISLHPALKTNAECLRMESTFFTIRSNRKFRIFIRQKILWSHATA